jgi:UDP-N-acetylmuramoylalanine--D-glutamate ligase
MTAMTTKAMRIKPMRVLVLGLGQYPKGSGVEAAAYFARRGDKVTVYDAYYAPAMDANVKRLKKFANVRFVFGKHALEEIAKADVVIKHQRLRMSEPEVVEARRLNKPLESELSVFLRHCPCRVVGVTGTRGKSTTTTLIYEMLKASGARTWLGGNILVSPLSFLDRVKKSDVVVLEMSSFQLEGTGLAGISPQVAVWTNLLRDHLNAYPGMEEYAEAKAQVFRHQQPGDVVFLPPEKSFDGYAAEAPGSVVRFAKKGSAEEALVAKVKLKLIGAHNRRNAMIATSVARHMGVSPSAIVKVLRTFAGLPNRLEPIGKKKGITFINDSTATTPDATMAAVRAVTESFGGNLVLIFGGADKELAFEEVASFLKKAKLRVILLPGSAHEKIVAAFQGARVTFEDVPTMEEAVRAAVVGAKAGDVVLLSPGAASFGSFKNEFDRADHFKKAVRRLSLRHVS